MEETQLPPKTATSTALVSELDVDDDNKDVSKTGKLKDNPKAFSSSVLNQPTAQQKLDIYNSQIFAEDERPDLPPISPHSRKCTDVLCLLLFLAYWSAMIGVAIFSYSEGNPKLLVYGTDNQGNLCGDGDFTNREFLALPRLALDLQESLSSGVLEEVKFFGICVNKCPSENQLICTDKAEEILSNDPGDRENNILQCLSGDSGCISKIVSNECFNTIFNTTSFLFRCLPEFIYEVETIAEETGCVLTQNFTNSNGEQETNCVRFRTVEKITSEEPPDSDIISSTFNTVGRQVQQIVSDLIQTVDVIAYVGLGFSLGASVLYVSLLWVVVGPIVWGSLLLIIFTACAFTLYLYVKSGLITSDNVEELVSTLEREFVNATGSNININISDLDLESLEASFPAVSENYQQQYTTAAYAFTFVTILLILVILCMIPKISKAVQFFEEASHTLRSNLGLLFVPPVVALLILLNACFFLASLAFSQTVGEVEISALNFSLDPDANITSSEFVSISSANIVAVFYFLGFLWTTQFVIGVSTIVISHVIAQSYWDTEPGTIFYKSGSISRGWRETFRFHLGTVAFGSLLIAIVQLIRYLAAFVDQKTKQLQQENRIIKYAMKAVHCFLYCAEQCVKFISSNAYIITAMYGTSFLKSSQMAFFAIASNLAQVGAVTFLGEIIIRFGQILITLLGGIITAAALDYQVDLNDSAIELSSVLPPILIVMIFCWIISGGVLNIYHVAVETLLISYCQDRKRLKLRGHGKDDLKKSTDIRGVKSFKDFVESHKGDELKLASQKRLYNF